MKILQVVPYFPPAYAFGGPAKVAYQISRELSRRGHKVVVYTSDARDSGSRLAVEPNSIIDGVRVQYFRNLALILVNKLKLFITPQLILYAKEEEKFDVVHLHEYRTFQNIVAAHYAKKYGVPYVLQAHGSLLRIMAKKKWKWVYDVLFGYRVLKGASRVIALSHAEVQQYKSRGVPEEKIVIVPNSIDLSKYANLPSKGSFKKKFSLNKETKIILYLGRIHRIKGIDILVKAFAEVAKKFNDTKLVIVGPDDGYLSELQALIETMEMEDNVLICGPLWENGKLEAYVDADVYVLPSRYETFPMSALESIACGTPVILTDKCSVANFVRNKVGLVVKPCPDELANAINEMLQDNEIYDIFRRNRESFLRKFNLSKAITMLEKIYEKS